MIPDDNPNQGLYMTLKDIRTILTDYYGLENGNRMPPHEVDQICATLKDGIAVNLLEAKLALIPAEEAPGLYCCWMMQKKEGS